jgi:predicted CXXCH cytochrome family protein
MPRIVNETGEGNDAVGLSVFEGKKTMMRTLSRRLLVSGLIVVCCSIISGCEPITRHKVVSTIFDGVPSLPPPEQLCAEYADKRLAAYRDELAQKSAFAKQGAKGGSQHPPYVEKKCDDCHDKTKENGLVGPRTEFCFICHAGFVKGTNIHGPVAVGDCLSCHEPHTSNHPSLLKTAKTDLCLMCHKEARLVQGLHDKARAREMECLDCHDPHAANAPFFLK